MSKSHEKELSHVLWSPFPIGERLCKTMSLATILNLNMKQKYSEESQRITSLKLVFQPSTKAQARKSPFHFLLFFLARKYV